MNETKRGPDGRLALLLLGLMSLVGGCGAQEPEPRAEAPADTLLPVTDTLLPVNGTRLFVRRVGTGEPLLVVHGGPVLDHGYLVQPLRPLADRFQLVFYDQRLSGRSDGSVDSASVTLASFVRDIEALRETLGLQRIHLLGHSWGGLLAMKYALAHPARVRSLVLVSPMSPSAALWQEEAAALSNAIEPADTAGIGALRAAPGIAAHDPAAVERLLQLSFRSQLHDRRRADELRFHIPDDYSERSRQFGYLMPELSSYDLVDELEDLRVPTLLVYGAAEAGAPIGAAALRGGVPDIAVEVIDDAGHFAFLERPEAFQGALRTFLRER